MLNLGSGFRRGFYVLICSIFVVACRSGDRTLEDEVRERYPIDRDATLTVRNQDGAIMIYGGGGPEVKMEATKRAYSERRLSEIAINVAATANAVSIETKIPPRETGWFADRSGTVDYIIVVPDTMRIAQLELETGEMLIDSIRGPIGRAKLGNGRLFTHNCFADTNIFVATGNFAVIYDWWEKRKFSVDASIQDGNGFAYIPRSASFHLVANTKDGKIGNDFTEQENRTGATVMNIDKVVGGPSEITVSLRATEGNINVVQAHP
jgi:hypothetical protein